MNSQQKDGISSSENGGSIQFEMMIEMGEMGPDVIMPDERAAGVISGSDPYRELELYLEKVNEEFGEVFERWLHPEQQKMSTLPKQNGGLKHPQTIIPVKSKLICNGNHVNGNESGGDVRSRSLPSKANSKKKLENARTLKKAEETEWSENIMADFDQIIAKELDKLQTEVNKERDVNSSCSSSSSSSSISNSSESPRSLHKNPKTYQRSFSDDPNLKKETFALIQPENFIIVKDIRYHSLPTKQNGKAVLVRITPVKEEEPEKNNSDPELSRKGRVNHSPDRIKEFFRSTSPFGKRKKANVANTKASEDGKGNYRLQSDPPDIPPPVPARKKKLGQKIPAGLQNFLTKLRPDGSPPKEQATVEDRAAEKKSVSVATQTSPALSRSSSFTWMSDCSSSFILNAPESLSDDKLSVSSGRSSSSPPRIRCDNGCESECDCVTSESRDSSPESPKEAERSPSKEEWEMIRRRRSELLRIGLKENADDTDVWVRRESVHTQTNDEAETDREPTDEETSDGKSTEACGLPPRPKNETGNVAIHSLPLRFDRTSRPHNLLIPNASGSPGPSLDSGKELPSPTTVSLKLPASPLSPELGNKSSSAPVIMKQLLSPEKDPVNLDQDTKKMILKQPRSQSERHLAEIEAAEACKWLRAAGFPQYAQMYEDLQFPIDVSGVQKDHPFLDKDSLQSLFRRLHALNRCAKMKIDNPPKNSIDDSDEDDQCALSENWTFQPESRRWSRICDVSTHHTERLHSLGTASDEKPDSSVESDRLMSSGEDLIGRDDAPVIEKLRFGSLPQGAISEDSELLAGRFRRTGSERLRDGAKAILRRMESLKSRRRKKQHRENVVISGPQVLDMLTMQQKMKDLNCVDVSPTATSGSSPEHSSPLQPPAACPYLTPPFADDSSSYCSDNSQGTPVHQRTKSKLHRAKKFFHGRKNDESGALSDSEVQPTSWRHRYLKDANSNHTKVVEYIDGRNRGAKDDEYPGSSKICTRGGSLNLGKESQRYRDKVQASFRRKPLEVIEKSGSSELTEDSSSTLASQADSDQDPNDITLRQRVTVVRWHSFQRGTSRPDSYYQNADSNVPYGCRAMSALSCGQLLVLRKMSLLKLTACMEKYCPTHRTGWNWELPKFIRKIKAPDYKDKTVFGVPLLLSLQRSGQALPKCIQIALKWLRTNALDQVGLFRKSGVRSRIQSLKTMTENQGETISYDGHQAYDVADMVKQYFRELPEALLTNKLSETFISIFQHVPVTLRAEAVQWVILLLPDEHREALQAILEFLNQVSARSKCNQMTESNLAVCLAPSLFHLHHPSPGSQSRSASASPRRRKTVGVPDQRELGENKAAHDCLLYLMREHKEVFVVNEETFANCRFTSMDYSIPMTLEQLGSELSDGWRGYLKESITSFLREAKEKSRGWVNVPSNLEQNTEIAYKKVGDGHPLRLWKVWTEVEAPPQELVRRVLRERHVWDMSLLKWRVVSRLDSQSEIFQFVCGSMPPLPAKDYCVLRSWRTDLPKGACVIVETSVEHPDAPVLLGGVRGVVLASRYLIEPCGSGKSRIVHLSRVDTKGRSPEWYNKSYGHICAMHLSRIRSSFKHNTEGPESKV